MMNEEGGGVMGNVRFHGREIALLVAQELAVDGVGDEVEMK